MVDIIGATGVALGGIAILISGYSLFKQSKLEERLKEKEKMRVLADKVGRFINRWVNYYLNINDPENDEDRFCQLEFISQMIISKSFDEKKNAVNITAEVDLCKEKTIEGKKEFISLPIKNSEDIIEYFERSEPHFCWLSVDCGLENSNMSYDILTLYSPFFDLNELKENKDLIEKLNPDPRLLEDLNDCFKEICMTIINSALKSKMIEINVKDFAKTEDIGLWIYNKVVGVEELKPSLDKLEELKNQLEKLRDNLVKIGYA